MTKMILAIVVTACLVTPDEGLDKAAAKAAEMTNYSYKTTTTVEGLGKDGGVGKPVTIEVKIEKDKPWQVKGGATEAFKQGEKVIVKDGDAWKEMAKPGKPADGSKPDRKAMAVNLALRGLKAPHEQVKDIGTKIKEVKREDSDGGACYSGELTEDAAKEFGAMQSGKAAGKNATFKYTGSVKVFVNGEGSITKLEIVTEGKGAVKDQEMTIKQTRTIEISEVGSTKVEVPEEVTKLLGQ